MYRGAGAGGMATGEGCRMRRKDVLLMLALDTYVCEEVEINDSCLHMRIVFLYLQRTALAMKDLPSLYRFHPCG